MVCLVGCLLVLPGVAALWCRLVLLPVVLLVVLPFGLFMSKVMILMHSNTPSTLFNNICVYARWWCMFQGAAWWCWLVLCMPGGPAWSCPSLFL